MKRHEGLRVRGKLEQRRQARHHEYAGGHHGGGMDQRGNRGRAFHGVRQPGVQQELRRLAHRAHEEQQAGDRQRIDLPAEEIDGLAGERGRLREHGVEFDRAGQHEHREDAERKAKVADAVDDESLDRRSVRLRLVIPEADQQVAREADAFPAEEQLHEIVCRHQHQHREGEHRQIAEKPRPIRVFMHVADRIKVHESGYGVDHHQHHGGQSIDPQRPVDLEIAGRNPGQDRHAHIVMAKADMQRRRSMTGSSKSSAAWL